MNLARPGTLPGLRVLWRRAGRYQSRESNSPKGINSFFILSVYPNPTRSLVYFLWPIQPYSIALWHYLIDPSPDLSPESCEWINFRTKKNRYI